MLGVRTVVDMVLRARWVSELVCYEDQGMIYCQAARSRQRDLVLNLLLCLSTRRESGYRLVMSLDVFFSLLAQFAQLGSCKSSVFRGQSIHSRLTASLDRWDQGALSQHE